VEGAANIAGNKDGSFPLVFVSN